MFQDMRRKKQALSMQECLSILDQGSAGVLAVCGDDDYPYAVPLSYVVDQGKIYFHCARSGHKLNAIKRNPKVSFCVIDQNLVQPLEYTTYYRSVIAFGEARILIDEKEKYAAVKQLALKYAPQDTEEHREEAIKKDFAPVCMVEITIQRLTGKQARELLAKPDSAS